MQVSPMHQPPHKIAQNQTERAHHSRRMCVHVSLTHTDTHTNTRTSTYIHKHTHRCGHPPYTNSQMKSLKTKLKELSTAAATCNQFLKVSLLPQKTSTHLNPASFFPSKLTKLTCYSLHPRLKFSKVSMLPILLPKTTINFNPASFFPSKLTKLTCYSLHPQLKFSIASLLPNLLQ